MWNCKIVIGVGESGFSPRPVQAEWVKGIQQCCQQFDVPFFFKQWGGRNEKVAGRELDGKFYDALPAPKHRKKLVTT